MLTVEFRAWLGSEDATITLKRVQDENDADPKEDPMPDPRPTCDQCRPVLRMDDVGYTFVRLCPRHALADELARQVMALAGEVARLRGAIEGLDFLDDAVLDAPGLSAHDIITCRRPLIAWKELRAALAPPPAQEKTGT